jgi:short subunit dehydrogenase-like uncharacterized protein
VQGDDVTERSWLIYGASGYTGTLIAEEAHRQGLRPILAGRSEARVRPVAERLGLDWRIAELREPQSLRRAITDVGAVLHCAGPFVDTSKPMIDACLDAGAHYLDITGEIPVFEDAYAQDAAARQRGIVLMPGVGFDVVPTDCLARHLAELLPDAWSLEIAIAALGQASPGTTKSAARGLLRGGLVRRGGRLESYPVGRGVRKVHFDDKERLVMPIPWGDLASAWRSTRIPNITTYAAMPSATIAGMSRFGWMANAFLPLLRPLIERTPLQGAVDTWIERRIHGPDAQAREIGSAHIWACVTNQRGESRQACLQTLEGYRFTALSAVAATLQVLAGQWSGALAPAQAFGADFVLSIAGSTRRDLPIDAPSPS